jgi:arginine deiminase
VPSVYSETGRLRKVIVQPPGPALVRVLPSHIHPSSSNYLLYDDLIHVPQAQVEHRHMTDVLGSVAEVLRFDTLVTDALSSMSCRSKVLERVASLHSVSDADLKVLEGAASSDLTEALIAGGLPGDPRQMFPPIPNLVFTRDLAAIVGKLVVVGNASMTARHRESILTWAVVDHHPLFAQSMVSESSRRGVRSSPLTIEGGDVLVISSSLACIGASERTSWSMIVNLSQELVQQGFTRILVVEMPKQRSSMHLDTVFTMIDWDSAVIYRPLMHKGDPEEANVLRLRAGPDGLVVEDLPGDLLDALAQEGHPLAPVLCGGGDPIHERREQWTDGANYMALGPGVVMGYARNTHTARHMEDRGYTVIEPADFLTRMSRDYHDDPEQLFDSGDRYAIHIPGSELSRGRGGPRCLTLPLLRDA